MDYQLLMRIFVPASAAAVRSDFRGFIRYLASLDLLPTLDSFSTLHLGNYLAHQRARVKGATLKRWYKSFFGCGKWAAARGYLERNPMIDIALGWVPVNRREFILSPQDALRFLTIDCRTGLLPEVDRALRCLGLFAGLRRSEYLKLLWRHIDLDRRELTIFDSKFTRRKGNSDMKDRVIPLCQPLREALAALYAVCPHNPDDHVLVNRRLQPLGRDGFYAAFGAIWGAMGVGQEVVPHSLRHSLAGNMLAVGATHADVALLLGHRNSSPDGRPTTTDLYITSSLPRVRSFLDRYAALVMSVGKEPLGATIHPNSGPVPVWGRVEAVDSAAGGLAALATNQMPRHPEAELCSTLRMVTQLGASQPPAAYSPTQWNSRPSPAQVAEAVVLWRRMYPDVSVTGTEFSEFLRLIGVCPVLPNESNVNGSSSTTGGVNRGSLPPATSW